MIFRIKPGHYIPHVVYYWHMDLLFTVNHYAYKNTTTIPTNFYESFITGNFSDLVLYFDMVSLEPLKGQSQ